MTHIAKIIDIVGSSEKSWEDAAQVALTEATKTIHGITGIELTDMTARVDPNTGKITEYHSTVKIAFGVTVPKDLRFPNSLRHSSIFQTSTLELLYCIFHLRKWQLNYYSDRPV